MASRLRNTPLSSFGSRTDIGCVRDHNEDSLVVAPPLFAVCDGMGGHAAGEVASEIATQVIADRAPSHADATGLARAVEAANAEIIAAAQDGRGREGMGTTCTAAMIEGERLVIAQVGDSRAYLLHAGKLQQITRDHSLVADMVEAGQITADEARIHPSRSIITRALGTSQSTHPDLYEINVAAGDRLMLCSDGLSGMIEDSDIEEVMTRITDPQRCASVLVNEAIEAGGLDNVTVIVVNIEGLAEKRRRKVAVKTKVTVAITLVLLAAIIAGTAFGVSKYTSTVAYVGEDNGHVAVYRGVPGSFLGLTFSEYVETDGSLLVDDLDKIEPGLAQRVRDGGVKADSVADLETKIAAWKVQLIGADSQTPQSGTASDAGNTANTGDAAGASNTGDAAATSTAAAETASATAAGAAQSDAGAGAQG